MQSSVLNCAVWTMKRRKSVRSMFERRKNYERHKWTTSSSSSQTTTTQGSTGIPPKLQSSVSSHSPADDQHLPVSLPYLETSLSCEGSLHYSPLKLHIPVSIPLSGLQLESASLTQLHASLSSEATENILLSSPLKLSVSIPLYGLSALLPDQQASSEDENVLLSSPPKLQVSYPLGGPLPLVSLPDLHASLSSEYVFRSSPPELPVSIPLHSGMSAALPHQHASLSSEPTENALH